VSIFRNITNKEFDLKLLETFPHLYKDMHGDSRATNMAFGVGVDKGWREIIWEVSEKLENIILSKPEKDQAAHHMTQCKEKFGGLRIYLSWWDDETNILLSEAENKSLITCEYCGKPGTLQRTGWWRVWCDPCLLLK
jgi:hypothetical protein